MSLPAVFNALHHRRAGTHKRWLIDHIHSDMSVYLDSGSHRTQPAWVWAFIHQVVQEMTNDCESLSRKALEAPQAA